MKPSVEQISHLLSHRRDLRHDEAYWQDFLGTFHHNQRLTEAAKSSPIVFFDFIRGLFSEISPSKWAYGAGLAYAFATIAFLVVPRSEDTVFIPNTPIIHQILPAPAPAVEQLKPLNPDSSAKEKVGEKEF